MILRKAFKFRLKPKFSQLQKLVQAAGCSRFVWNRSLEAIKQDLEDTKKYQGYCHLANQLREWKQHQDTSFLRDVHSQPLQQTLKDLDRAIRDAFNKKNPKRFPRFKKRGCRDSFRYPQGFKINSSAIYLPKIGWVRFSKTRDIEGKIKNVTVSRRGLHWYVSIQTEQTIADPIHPSNLAVGIDMGIAQFATLSDGQALSPLNSFKTLAKKLAKAQQILAKKKRYSANWKKQKAKITKLHLRIANLRYDYLHKISTAISKNHAVVILEDLKVSNMSASAKGTKENPGKNVRAKAGLNKSILDQGWYEFRRQLTYKLVWRGGDTVLVPPHHTSQKCSKCGHVSADNRQSQVKFVCLKCCHSDNADVNAAQNILRAGLARIACGEETLVTSVKQEPPQINLALAS